MNTPDLPDLDLHAVESAVATAIRRRSTEGLHVLGHGEISLVLAWPTTEPAMAIKRVPPFRSLAAAQQYTGVCEEFFERLHAAGVAVWPTTLHVHERADGRAVVYHRQPIADVSQLGTNVLRATTPVDDHPLLLAIADAAAAVCAPTVGFDCQAANWLWDGTTATQLDFTSPFTLVPSRKELTYDPRAFLQEYPVVVRPYLKREFTSLIHRYTTAEGALGDMLANLFKEGLEAWVDPAISTFNRRLGLAMQRSTAQRMYDDDRKLMPLVLKLKKTHRWWLTSTGRRYEQLLPVATTYGR